MKNYAFFLAVLMALISVNEGVASEAGLLKTVSGHVTITRDQMKIKAEKGMQLETRDVLSTGQESTAGIIFSDGTVFTLGPDAEFEMRKYAFEPGIQSYDFSVFLKKGTVVYNSGKIAKLAPEAVDIQTPKATVGIRGTRLIISVD